MAKVRDVIKKCGDGAEVEVWIYSWGGKTKE